MTPNEYKIGATVDVFGVKFGFLEPKTLTAHPLNYRTHPEKQKNALAASVAEHGLVQFPIWNERTNRLIDGHCRVEGAQKDGWAGMPCVIVDKDEPSELRLLASLDRIGEMRGHDEALLARLLQDCLADNPVMPAGWDEDNLADLLIKFGGDVDLTPTDTLPARPQLEDGEEGEQEGGVPTEEAASARQPSSVKMLQLFLTVDSEKEFQALCKSLGEVYGTPTITDTVLFCVQKCAGEEGLWEGDEDCEDDNELCDKDYPQ